MGLVGALLVIIIVVAVALVALWYWYSKPLPVAPPPTRGTDGDKLTAREDRAQLDRLERALQALHEKVSRLSDELLLARRAIDRIDRESGARNVPRHETQHARLSSAPRIASAPAERRSMAEPRFPPVSPTPNNTNADSPRSPRTQEISARGVTPYTATEPPRPVEPSSNDSQRRLLDSATEPSRAAESAREQVRKAFNDAIDDPDRLEAFADEFKARRVELEEDLPRDLISGKLLLLRDLGDGGATLLPGPDVVRDWRKFYTSMGASQARDLLGRWYYLEPGAALEIVTLPNVILGHNDRLDIVEKGVLRGT